MIQPSIRQRATLPVGSRDPQAVQRLALAVQELDRVESGARPDELACCMLSVARCYADLDMHDTAEWYYRQALGSSRPAGGLALQVDGFSGLAEALIRRSELSVDPADRYTCLERARDLAFQAASLAGRCLAAADQRQALARVAAVLDACGDTGDAQALRQRADSLSTTEDPQAA